MDDTTPSPSFWKTIGLYCFQIVCGLLSFVCTYAFYHHPESLGDKHRSEIAKDDSWRQSKASIAAMEQLITVAEGGTIGPIDSALSAARIVGLYPLTLSSAAGSPEVEPIGDTQSSYKVTVPFLYRGATYRKRNVTVLYRAEMMIAMSPDGETHVENTTFVKVQEANYWHLVRFSFYTSVFIPLLIFVGTILSLYMILGLLIIYLPGDLGASLPLAIAAYGTRIAGSINAAWVTYICWRSVLGSAAATGAFLGAAWAIEKLVRYLHTWYSEFRGAA